MPTDEQHPAAREVFPPQQACASVDGVNARRRLGEAERRLKGPKDRRLTSTARREETPIALPMLITTLSAALIGPAVLVAASRRARARSKPSTPHWR